MRIAVIGGGPAGLYFALLMKKLDPGHDIVVVEQNAAGATYGFGVVFSEKALAFHEAGDPETYQLITPKAEAWDDLAIVHRDRRIPIDGNGFAAMGRLELLRLFHDACRAAGIAIEFGKRVDGLDRFGDYDLVVGADGAGSIVREIHARFFRPKRQVLSNKFAWYGTRQWFETLTLTFRTNADGAFVAHHYRYSPEMSTFIVECDAGTWDRAGFARMRDDESRRYCEQVFAPDLGGHRLIDNKSMWRSFPILTNDNWRHDKLVLIGDALRTVHFSIGSGTRLAMEDALALYSAFRDAGPAVKRALARFEETRRPIVDKLLRAAANSAMWYERFHEIMHLDPHDLVYSYMTRTGRVDEPGLRKIAPRFMAGFDAHRAAKAPPAGSRIAASPADAPVDALGDDSPGAREIGFSPPQRYNASDILFRNLEAGRAAKAAIYCNGKTTTYGELCALANRIGRALIGLGLGRGERVLLVLDDTPVYAGAIFGALKAGFVPVLTNTLSTKDLLEYFIQDGQAPVAIVEGRLVGLLRDAGRQCPSLGCVVCVGEPSHEIGVRTLDWQAWTAAASPDLDAADTSRDDMAFWMYSSGTTGRPKGVVHLHHDMLYTYESYGKHVLGIRADDVVFSVPKLFFAYGFGNSITFPFSVGAGAALHPGRPDPKAVFDCIERYRPTIFFGLPTLYIALLADDSAGARNLSSIRLFISAAEPLSFETFGRWKELYGGEIVEGLGSTELLHIYLSNQPGEARVGTAGRRVPGYEIKLLDPDGNEVPKGEVGNMLVRGHSQSPGYWKQPEKTAATMRGTWIFTGDRFREDEDGFYRFAGRADELIKVSGQWIHPLEIERCLAEHPAVHECAVLGLERSDRRMTTKAFVKLRAGHARSEDVARALQNFVKERLLPYKYPRLVEFVDELPKTGTGKIDRQALRRQPSDQEGGPGPGRP